MRAATKGYILCFLGVFSWSFSEIIVWLLKPGSPGSGTGVGSISLSFYRFFFGGVFLLVVMVARKDLAGFGELIKKDPTLMVLSSVVGLGISNMIYFLGIQAYGTEAHVGAALYTSYTLFIGVYSIFILDERTNIPLKIVGFIIGFLGILILLTNFDFAIIMQPDKITGNIMLVLAGAIWGFYSVLGKKIFRRNPGIKNVDVKFTIWSFFLSCIPIVVTLPFSGEIPDFLQHGGAEWALVAALSIVCTGLGLYVFFVGVKTIDVSHGISFSLLKPVIAAFFAFVLLARPIPDAMWVSVPLVSVAVLLINKKPRKDP
ncbi:MAG: DMT family transporter [Candidatus Lokiarchaeota archaeon]|nr:DMT family transporter [Candidatus Lokiarchaeota archaeon]